MKPGQSVLIVIMLKILKLFMGNSLPWQTPVIMDSYTGCATFSFRNVNKYYNISKYYTYLGSHCDTKDFIVYVIKNKL